MSETRIKGARILVVDDEPNIRRLLSGVLEDEGASCADAAVATRYPSASSNSPQASATLTSSSIRITSPPAKSGVWTTSLWSIVASYRELATVGIATPKHEPLPGSDSTSMRCSSRSASLRTIARPRPKPSLLLPGDLH